MEPIVNIGRDSNGTVCSAATSVEFMCDQHVKMLTRFKAKISTMLAKGVSNSTAFCIDPTEILPSCSKKKLILGCELAGCVEGRDFRYFEDGYISALFLRLEGLAKVTNIWDQIIEGHQREQFLQKKSRMLHEIDFYVSAYVVPDDEQVQKDHSTGMNMEAIRSMIESISEKIELHGIGLRKDFQSAVVNTYAKFLLARRSGRCPLSGDKLVDNDGGLLPGAECDHFYSRTYNALNGGWLISASENKKLRNPAYRASITTRFLAFHSELEQWLETREGKMLFE
jgi:hypothetical protein